MAIGRLNVRVGKKGKALAHANYILREDKYRPHAEKFEKLENTGFGNMPSWAKDNPKLFWLASDEFERKNGSVYREHIIALPRELSEEKRLNLVNDWIEKEIGDKHPYSFAIHTPKAMDGKDQPHVHLMFSERINDGIERGADQFFKRFNSKNPERGGAEKGNKQASWTDRKTALIEQRMRWQEMCNFHLQQAGFKKRIDMRNYKERGLKKKPLNISMLDMLKPEVRQAYQARLLAKRDYQKLMFTLHKNVADNNLSTELKIQKQRKHKEAIKTSVEEKYAQWKQNKNNQDSQSVLSDSEPNSQKPLSFQERRQAWKDEQERIKQQQAEMEKQRLLAEQAEKQKQAQLELERQREIQKQRQLAEQLEKQRQAELERQANELLKQQALECQQAEEKRQAELEKQQEYERRNNRSPSP